MIVADTHEIENLLQAFLEAPGKTKYVASVMLNQMAFGTRKIIPNTLKQTSTVRSPGLHRAALWVQKASKTDSFLAMHSIVGSVKLTRFSGWWHQDTGERDPRTHRATRGGRSGALGKVIPRQYRLDPSVDFERSADYPDTPNRTIVMLQKIARNKCKKPFIVSGFDGMKSGLYKFEGSAKYKHWVGTQGYVRRGRGQKLRLLQMFGRSKESIKKRPWMDPSVDKYFAGSHWTDKMEEMLLKNFFFKPGKH